MKTQLIVEQKITPFVNKYAVYQATDAGTKGNMVAFAQQKRLKIKEKIEFYTDDAKSQLAFTLRAEKIMDVHGKYLVEDPAGKLIGAFRKDFAKSLVVSTWHVVDAQDKVTLTIGESNEALAVMRRFAGFIPIVGEFVDILLVFFRYHFTFTENGQPVGKYRKTTLFRDYYALDFDDQAYARQDWRVMAAMAVALDALQSR